MKIHELPPESNVTIIARIGLETVELSTVVHESYPQMNLITADAVYRNDRIVTFKAQNLTVDILYPIQDSAPLLFSEVTIDVMKRGDGTLCYAIATEEDGKNFNRRDGFRAFVGVTTLVQAAGTKEECDAIIKDISNSGFGIACTSEATFQQGQILHASLDETLEEGNEHFHFELYGVIVRVQELESGRIVYGCRLNNKIPNLDAYIMKKERLRIKKQRS